MSYQTNIKTTQTLQAVVKRADGTRLKPALIPKDGGGFLPDKAQLRALNKEFVLSLHIQRLKDRLQKLQDENTQKFKEEVTKDGC